MTPLKLIAKSYKKLLASLLLVALLLPYPYLTRAQPINADNFSDISGINQQFFSEAARFQQEAERALKEERQQEAKDLQECVPQKPGAGLATSFANVISRGIQQTLSQTVNRVVSQNINNIIQRQVGQVLPQVIQQGLAQQLPNALRQRFRGMSESERNQRGPALMQEEIRRLLPEIIRRDFPNALQGGISRSLTQHLTTDYQNQILASSSTLNASSNPIFLNEPSFQFYLQLLFGPLGIIAETIGPDQIAQLVQHLINKQIDELLNAALSGDVSAIQDEIQRLRKLPETALRTIVEQIKTAVDLMLANLANSIQAGMANDAANGIAKGDGVALLVDRMMPVLMQILLNGNPSIPGSNGLLAQFSDTRFESAISAADYNRFNFNDFAGNNITAAIGFDLRPVSEAIAEPLALAVVSGLGVSGFDRAVGNLAIAGFQGTPTISDLRFAAQLNDVGANYLGAISNVYHGPFNSATAAAFNSGDINATLTTPLAPLPTLEQTVNPEAVAAFHAQNPDFVGPVSATDIIGADAAKAVDGGQIGTNIGQNFTDGLSGLGAQIGGQLTGALVNSVAAGVGGLVEGVPYVGGLLAPIAEGIVRTALFALLGPISLLFTGVPVQDSGLRGVSKTVRGVGEANIEPLIKIEGLNKQQIEQNKNALEQQQVEIQRATANCLVLKKNKNAMEALDELARVKNPAAFYGSLAIYGALSSDWQKIKNAANESLLHGPQAEKEPLFIPAGQVLENAAEEGRRQSLGESAQSGEENRQAAAGLIDRTSRSAGWGGQTLTQAEQKRLGSKAATPRERVEKLPELYSPHNDSRAAYLAELDRVDSGIARKITAAITQTIAGSGYQNKQECAEWVIIPPYKEWCKTWKVTTPGAVNAEADARLATFVLDKLAQANSFKEAELGPALSYMMRLLGNYGLQPEELSATLASPCPGLEPCDPKTGYDPSAYTTASNIRYGGSNLDHLTISENFANGLNTAVENGLNNVSNMTENQLNNFTGYLTQGIGAARFSSGDAFQRSNTMTNVITRALDQTGGIAPSDYPAIINALLQILLQRILGQ